MAWFGDNLMNITGNLTGQLSNVANTAASFTRDVLAEGTEEVEDQGTELKLAHDKLKEYETFVISQKAENERLQILNAELTEKAEASELQINTISQQYRTVLQEKQDEIKNLKQQQHQMQNLHQDMLSASVTNAGMTTSTSTTMLTSSVITGDDHDRDFVDVISSQHEINRLSNEVSRLKAECDHWKNVAETNSSQGPHAAHFQMGGDSLDTSDENSAQLKAKIKELERQLTREIDESQHQMSMLQNAHSQKMSTLAKKHKAEMEDYHLRIEELEQVLSSGSSTPSSTSTMTVVSLDSPDRASDKEDETLKHLQDELKKALQSLAHLESENQELKMEVDTLRNSDRDRGHSIADLQEKIEELVEEKEKLIHDNDILNYVKKDLAGKLDIEQEEGKRWKVEFEEVEKNMEKQKELMEKQKMEEVDLLQQRIKEQEEELENLRSDNEQVSENKSSIATLEAASNQTWDQTASVITDMGDPDQQELTSEFITCLESENKILREKVSHLESVEQRLNDSCASLADDKQQCEQLIMNLNKKIQSLKGCNDLDPETSSERTLEGAVESETAKLKSKKSEPQRRSQSPSQGSVDSSATASSIGAAPVKTNMSESTIESDLPDSRLSSQLESFDTHSFEGEYDDSIMFGGIRERYPEAANALKEQIEQFELVRSDWEMEKEALEEVVVRMRDQLKEKDRALQSLTAEKGLMALETQQTEELNAAVEEMDKKIETLESAKKTLAEDKDVVMKEKEALELKIKELETAHQGELDKIQALMEHRDQLQVQVAEQEESINNMSLEVESYRTQLHDKETSLADISLDRSRLEGELQELDNQHQEAINQVMSSKDDLSRTVSQLKDEITSLSGQLADKDAVFNETQQTKENLEAELAHLKEKLQQTNQEHSEVQKSSHEREHQLSDFQSELSMLSERNKVLDNRKSELEVEVNELATQVGSLEAELSRLKQESLDKSDEGEKIRLDEVISKLEEDLDGAAKDREEAQRDLQNLQSELDQKDSEFRKQLIENEALNRTLNEKESELQAMLHDVELKGRELSDLQLDIEALSAEKESLSLDLKHSQQALEDQKQQFENSLHQLSESRDLDSSNLQEEYEKMILSKTQQDGELAHVMSKCENLEEDLNHTKEMLNSTLENHKQLADMVKEKDNDIKNLAEENSFFFKAVEEGKTKLKEQLKEMKRLEDIEKNLDQLKGERSSLMDRIKELEEAGDHWQDAESKTLGLITEMEAELGQFKKTVEEKDEEVSRLSQVIEEHETSLTEMKDQLMAQADELELSRSKFSESTNDFDALNQSIHNKDSEISALKRELDNTKQLLSEEQSLKSEELDASMADKDVEISELKLQVEKLNSELNKVNQKDEEIKMLQERVSQLNQKVESEKNREEELQDKLERISVEKDQIISDLKDKVNNLSFQNSSYHNHMDEKSFKTNGTVVESPVIVRDVELTQSSPPSVGNRNMHPAMSDTEKQFEKMVQEREREIKMLKDENDSVVKLLDDKSQSLYGNSNLVDLHKLQMQVRTYNSERNQMMTVLNEKTRECSNLKNEVHRLLKTVAAEKSALEKALTDNRDLQQSLQGPRKDMQKEAVTKLSRIIQDKDLEMEALKQKNDSLLQVLQQSAAPNDSTQISKVLQDNEQLQKENKVLKEERDQLVVSIHQKHHESLTYYEEVQRLSGIVRTENQKQAELKEKYNSLYADHDEKEKSTSELQVQVQEKDKALSNLESEIEQQNESIQFLEGQLMTLNQSIVELKSRNEELEDSVNASHHKQNEDGDLRLKVIEEKDAEILELKEQLQSMTLMSLDQADGDDRTKMVAPEVVQVQTVQLQHAPPPQNSTPPPQQIDPAELEAKDAEIYILKEQVDHQTKTLSEKEACIKKRSEEVEKLHIDVASLRQEIDIQNQNLLERDAVVQLRTKELQDLTNKHKSAEVELQNLKHSNHSSNVQRDGYKQEVQALKQENQNLQHAVHNKDGENRALQDMSNRLAAQIQEKEFEIGALKEKSATLTSLVQEKDVGSKGELQRVLRETEAMQRQALLFQQERDQALLALQRHQADIHSKDDQIQGLRQKTQQLDRELDRLRNHLLEMEEGYTQEAIQAEEREKELRTRLTQAEEKARTSSSAVQNASKEATAQIESLLDQLHSTSDQKDQALLQLASAQEQAQQYATSLNNLQMVLEQFQQEKDSAISSEVEMYQIRAKEKDRVAEQLMKTNVELQEKLASTTEALEGASRLSEQLDKKEETIEQMRAENEAITHQLEEYHQRFQEVSDVQESKVDKPLVKNLFLGYFHAPKSKRGDVIKIMSGLLNFTPDEIAQINHEGDQAQHGWLSGFWGRRSSVAPTPPSSPRPKSAFDSSFTESFVKFLQEESAPQPHMRLPIEEMSTSKARNPAFNPFSAPIPHQSPFMQTSPRASKGPGIPLPIPGAPSLTTLQATPVRAPTPVLESGGSGPGRGSPARSAAVLKDILQ